MVIIRIKCDSCSHEFVGLQIRKCPYSKKGAHVCVFCCKKCPYVKPFGTGWVCGYENKERLKDEKKKL